MDDASLGLFGVPLKKPLGCIVVSLFCMANFSFSQASQSAILPNAVPVSTSSEQTATGDFVQTAMRRLPWDRAVFFGGGVAASGGTGDHFLNAGVRLGKVLTGPVGPRILRNQFEYAAELMPYWQAFTPKRTYTLARAIPPENLKISTGGTYTGLSITPIILRWNMVRWRRAMPWVQGAGGLLWTNHKFPPNGSRGTSVWNFTPQFGVGVHYFLKPTQSITLGANAVHISSASLGDNNPGVNATVQFQIGYTWWK
jgi:lipid A 3-O-deacylase